MIPTPSQLPGLVYTDSRQIGTGPNIVTGPNRSDLISLIFRQTAPLSQLAIRRREQRTAIEQQRVDWRQEVSVMQCVSVYDMVVCVV